MAATSERARVAPGPISFELDRFEHVDGRLELSGRWFGIRGLRFVRPTLVLGFGDGSSSRALADLEHKPWAPFDGEQWIAAFPASEETKVLDAELDVAPGVAIRLPAPGEGLPDADPIAVVPAASAPPRRANGPAPTRRARDGGTRSDVPAELAALREETQRLRQEPIRLQAELDRAEELRKHVQDELERLKLDAGGAVARRDAAVDRFERMASELDEASTARDQAVRARDSIVADRDAAARDRDAAARERDEAVARRDRAVAERDRAVAQLHETVAERDRACADARANRSERDSALEERDQAIVERNKAVAAREEAVAERDKARTERDRARSGRVVPVAARAVTAPKARAHTALLIGGRDQVIKRAAAVVVLMIVILALLIVLRVL